MRVTDIQIELATIRPQDHAVCFSRGGDDELIGLVKIFDILYLNDTHLTHKRLSERKRLLKSGKIFKNIEDYQGRLEFAEEQRGKSGKDIRAMLERILETK